MPSKVEMSCYLIYHPKRAVQNFGGTTVHFDRPGGNQDPYVWNRQFLHSYCHITELKDPRPGDVNFWVSGDRFPDFNELACDLVFVVEQKNRWKDRNAVAPDDPIIDSALAYEDHYQWAYQHPFRTRTRFTLKANADASFQPQDAGRQLIDILPQLNAQGLSTQLLRTSMRKGFASKPMAISRDLAMRLLEVLDKAPLKLKGEHLQAIREGMEPGFAQS